MGHHHPFTLVDLRLFLKVRLSTKARCFLVLNELGSDPWDRESSSLVSYIIWLFEQLETVPDLRKVFSMFVNQVERVALFLWDLNNFDVFAFEFIVRTWRVFGFLRAKIGRSSFLLDQAAIF